MKAIVYYPKISENEKLLAENIARVHAKMVLTRLKFLSCPKEDKLRLVKKINNDYINASCVLGK